MWDAYVDGTIPVGAVIADDAGVVVSSGRNRIFCDADGTHLGRSRLAHAELNALITLGSGRTYETFTLYTSLEPCHMCLSAAIAVRIGAVHYAASDRYGGAVGKLAPSKDHYAHPLKIEGPLPGDPGRLPELLLVAHYFWRIADGAVARFYRTSQPELAAAAEALPSPGAGATLQDAFDVIG